MLSSADRIGYVQSSFTGILIGQIAKRAKSLIFRFYKSPVHPSLATVQDFDVKNALCAQSRIGRWVARSNVITSNHGPKVVS